MNLKNENLLDLEFGNGSFSVIHTILIYLFIEISLKFIEIHWNLFHLIYLFELLCTMKNAFLYIGAIKSVFWKTQNEINYWTHKMRFYAKHYKLQVPHSHWKYSNLQGHWPQVSNGSVRWSACSSWSFGPNSARCSIETMAILNTHPTVVLEVCMKRFKDWLNDSFQMMHCIYPKWWIITPGCHLKTSGPEADSKLLLIFLRISAYTHSHWSTTGFVNRSDN